MAPGGFIELSDISFPLRSDDGTLKEDSALYKWSSLINTAAAKLGRPFNSAEVIASELADAGFTNIVQRHFKWPQNHWPKDKKFKDIGRPFRSPSS